MQKELVTVRILEGGKTCREVSEKLEIAKKEVDSAYDLPTSKHYRDNERYSWAVGVIQEAETKLRTWEIEFPELIQDKNGNTFETVILLTFTNVAIYEVGSIHKAEIINGKAVIV